LHSISIVVTQQLLSWTTRTAMPGYLPEHACQVPTISEQDVATTLAKLPLAGLLDLISQSKMPTINDDGNKQGARPGCNGIRVSSQCSTRAGSRANSGSRPNSARPSSGGSRPNSARPSSGGSRPNSARPSSDGSRPNSARPNSARPSHAPSEPVRDVAGQLVFLRHMHQGQVLDHSGFAPRGFLAPKIIGNGSQWDQDRNLQPERAYPCIEKGAADFHDRNQERENRPAWKPTKANRVSGMGVQVGDAFPLPPRARPVSARPLSARPRSAAQN